MEKKILIAEDVLADETFLAWYFSKSEEKARSWEKWVAAHPEHQLLVDEAVKFLGQVQREEKDLPDTRVEAATERLKTAIAMQQDPAPVVSIKRSRNRWWIPVAAAIVIVCAGITIWKLSGEQKQTYSTAYGQLDKHDPANFQPIVLCRR